MTKVITREQQLDRIARKQRWLLAVYFASGILLPAPTKGYHLQTSSATITEKTLYVSHQSRHRS